MKRHSKKRDFIYSVLCASCDHPSTEELYNRVRAELPDIGMSTVYRNLAEFCEEGKAQIVGSISGQFRYDGKMNLHDHFICRECGSVYDIERTEAAEGMLCSMSEHGMQVDSFTVYGICNSCAD